MGLGTSCKGPQPPGRDAERPHLHLLWVLMPHPVLRDCQVWEWEEGPSFSPRRQPLFIDNAYRTGSYGSLRESMLGLPGPQKGDKHSLCQYLKQYNFLPENKLSRLATAF